MVCWFTQTQTVPMTRTRSKNDKDRVTSGGGQGPWVNAGGGQSSGAAGRDNPHGPG